MKIILTIFIAFIFSSVSAQVSFRTGSTQLDANLSFIDAHASANFESFRGDLSVSYQVSEKKIDYMAGSLKMSPGEIYFALDIALLSDRTVNEVIGIYQKNKSRGWGYIAQQAGIKPGSSEFHQLQANANLNKKKSNGKVKNKGNSKGMRIG